MFSWKAFFEQRVDREREAARLHAVIFFACLG
jgi:hypothetical protein